MFCPKCGSEIASNNRFCPSCGFPLSGTADTRREESQAAETTAPPAENAEPEYRTAVDKTKHLSRKASSKGKTALAVISVFLVFIIGLGVIGALFIKNSISSVSEAVNLLYDGDYIRAEMVYKREIASNKFLKLIYKEEVLKKAQLKFNKGFNGEKNFVDAAQMVAKAAGFMSDKHLLKNDAEQMKGKADGFAGGDSKLTAAYERYMKDILETVNTVMGIYENDGEKKLPDNTVSGVFRKVYASENFTEAIDDTFIHLNDFYKLSDFTYEITGMRNIQDEEAVNLLSSVIGYPIVIMEPLRRYLKPDAFQEQYEALCDKIGLNEDISAEELQKEFANIICLEITVKQKNKDESSPFFGEWIYPHFEMYLSLEDGDFKLLSFSNYPSGGGLLDLLKNVHY